MKVILVPALLGLATCLAAQQPQPLPLPPLPPCTLQASPAVSAAPATPPGAGPAASAAPAAATRPVTLAQPVCPTTLRLHMDRYLHAQFSLGAVGQPLLGAGWGQLRKSDGFPNSADGFVDRYRSQFLQQAVGKMTKHLVFPELFSQDEAYYRLGDGYPFSERLHFAVRHLFVTASADHTHEVFNAEGIPASLFASAAAIDFEPAGRRRNQVIFENAAWGVCWAVVGNLLSEFMPDIRARLP